MLWLILSCGLDGCVEDSVNLARASHWNAEAAIAGYPDPDLPTWRHTWFPEDDERFATQRECLRALRRSMPEGEVWRTYANSGEGWEHENVTHGPDYVEKFAAVGWVEGRANMMRTYYFACFQEAPRLE